MNWLIGVILIFIFLILLLDQLKKRKKKRLLNRLEKNWGKPKADPYYNFDEVSRYFNNTTSKDSAFHIISDQIKEDLDLDEIFKKIDRTNSKIGEQYLYYKLRVIESDSATDEIDELTQFMEKNSDDRLICQSELVRLSSHEAFNLELLIHGGLSYKPPYEKFLISLSLMSLSFIIIGVFFPTVFLLLIPVFCVNIILHYKTKTHINSALSAINQLNLTFLVCKNILKKSKVREYIKEQSFLKSIQSVRSKSRFIAFEKRLDSEIAMIPWFLFELIRILFNFESIFYFSLVGTIGKKRDDIENLFLVLGKLDLAISLASLKVDEELLCSPRFNNGKALSIQGMIHPLVEDCKPNSISLEGKSLLLTGSNMSGKTTFIRALGLNSLLAQSLNIAFAKEFQIPFYKVYSSIRISDDVLESTSYYLKEVHLIKELIAKSEEDKPCFFILDEIFKGTNTAERVAGGQAILKYLNNKKDFVVVSTHDIELADLLHKEDYDLYHFTEKIEAGELAFDHKLKEGKLKSRNAIKILDLYEYPKEIISGAEKIKSEYFGLEED
ncbi:MAG: DNA mismatch repair protein MutS [Crocinitomicaceae bacterium]|nr:DNA mismatch repair protein MutS [Crocinitomicaceae bacterium]